MKRLLPIVIAAHTILTSLPVQADGIRFIQRMGRETKAYVAVSDTNKDGFVSKEEYAANNDRLKPQDFKATDTNHDEFLSYDEIKAYRKKYANAVRLNNAEENQK